ncbi:hypothetical protein UFOVP1309_45 [uncultured Caudovirales phage]|uniref:Uncharacterized protein n=1 Tax=uncultured Caudovirales phage TaxID=2100421 RepID=A0A6J5RZT8_9CAUD|nr:hypothetical protein UFOVP1309_45 [uncultured Caudovirales phage]
MTTFSDTFTSYSDGQQNLNKPPDAVMANGFVPATPTSRGQPLPAQWLNWLLNNLFKLANRDVVTNNLGVNLFTTENAMIRLEAFDIADPNKYLVAIGYKAAGVAPSLKVISSATLTLGTGTINGNQPVIGGSNVKIVGYSRQVGDI